MTSNHQMWLDPYFKVFPGHYIVASAALGLFFFLVGAAISWRIDFAISYIQTLPVYLAVFGIAWVAAWLYWMSRKLDSVFRDVRAAFLISEKEFEALALLWTRRFFNTRLYLSGSTLVVASSWLYLAYLVYSGNIPWLPDEWSSEPYLWEKTLILGIYIIPVGFLVFTTGAGILYYCAFAFSISQQPLVPMIELARAKLRSLTVIGIHAGLAWSVGVALFVVFFRPAFDILSASIVFVLTGLGLLMISAPQFALHKALDRTKQALLDAVYHKWIENSGTHTPDDVEGYMAKFLSPNGARMQELIRSIIETPTWPYNPVDVMSVLGTWIIPFFALAVSQLLR